MIEGSSLFQPGLQDFLRSRCAADSSRGINSQTLHILLRPQIFLLLLHLSLRDADHHPFSNKRRQ